MIGVIFEVWLHPDHKDSYFDIAAGLKQDLQAMDGFVSVERFQSLVDEGKILSLSFWRDEEAVKGWRQHFDHRAAQKSGREGIFLDYRLRVAEVLRDYGMKIRVEAPEDSRALLG